MSIRTASVSVGTTATLLGSTGGGSSTGMRVLLYAPTLFYVGGSDVTVATGMLIPADRHFDDVLHVGEELYGIVASGTVAVLVYRGGV